MKSTRRHYGDLRYDRDQQASLGFGWIEVHEASITRTGQHLCRGYTRTEMMREYPFAGSPARVETYVCIQGDPDQNLFPGVSAGVKLVGLEENTYAELTSGPPAVEAGDIAIRRPIQTSSIVSKYDIDDQDTLLSRVETIQDALDEYGFVTHSTVTALDGSETETSSSYDHHTTGGKWLLGRLSQTTVEKTDGSSTIRKRSEFGYDSSSGLLTSEKIIPLEYDSQTSQWNSVAALEILTSYTLDPFGNTLTTTTTAGGEVRGSAVSYDQPRGRFVTSETNALGTVYHHYDQQLALQTGSTDVNGRTTTFIHDGFGTQIATYHPNRTKSAEITFYASNSDLPSQIQSELDAHFITLKWARCAEASGAPCVTTYFDQVGREVVTETSVLTSATPTYEEQYALKLYDERGRLVKESNPFLLGDAIHYITHTYDFLDRRILTTRPDGAESGIASVGRETLSGHGPCVVTVTKNPLGRLMTRWTDQHGRTVRTTDASNQITTFTHDVEGRLIAVAIDGVTQLTNTYDPLGNKIGVSDLSGGSTSSIYNGFGEVISTTDARLQTTITEYDELGRVTSVNKPEGLYTTTYRASGENLGAVDEINGPNGYLETFTYGENDHNYGLVVESSTRQASVRPTYTTLTEYDCLGQPVRATDAGGAVVETTYDTTYPVFALETRLIATADIPSGLDTLISRAPTLTTTGNDIIAAETLPHGITRTTTTDARNGYLKSLYTTGPGGELQNHIYTWDFNGNLLSRTDGVNGETETFGYDHLDRLESSQVANQTELEYRYDEGEKGNLISKTGESGPRTYENYRVKTAKIKGVDRDYDYDDAGFVIADGQRSYTWTSFGQLASVSQTSAPAVETFFATGQFAPTVPGIPQEARFYSSNVTATFEFDAAGNRARQVLDRTYNMGDQAMVTTRYLGSYEFEEHLTFQAGGGYGENKIRHRHRLGGATYLKETDASGTKYYLSVTLTDHIGSTDAVLRAEWNTSQGGWKLSSGEPRAERQSFGAWGERREQSDWTASRTAAADPHQTTAVAENHGYTGHEMLDDFGLVHMNGRIYDPELGRMLSPDPYVQVPEFSQNFNRYSYVLNNPLSMSDPSGNLIEGLHVAADIYRWASVDHYMQGHPQVAQYFNMAIQIVLAVVGTPPAVVGAVGGALNARASGLSNGDQIKAAAIGAFQGFLTSGLLKGIESSAGTALDAAVAGTDTYANAAVHVAGHIVAHGIVGGAANAAMGGKFEDGFLSAAAGAALGWTDATESLGLGSAGDWWSSERGAADFAKLVGRTVVTGTIGGTASAIGGGKFANGAYTAAFQHLLNAELPQWAEEQAIINSGKAFASSVAITDPEAWAEMEAGFYQTSVVMIEVAGSFIPVTKGSLLASRALSRSSAAVFIADDVTYIVASRSTAAIHQMLRPSGKLIGDVVGRASPKIRTISREALSRIQQKLLNGAKVAETYAHGTGQWYDLPAGGRVGVRISKNNGVTLDLNIPGFGDLKKLHHY
ncbi:hypothetical protein Hsar01_04090 [Haloferula sargassicola]|uniref:RHS repeat-associated core domain-containing protein n=1 Tax=Haloferula sargassicola TaxID=490096 RepID=A0ABP9UUB1_9BACT